MSNRPIIAWPTWSIGSVLAAIVLAGVLLVAFVGSVHIVNFDLWMLGLLALSRLL